MGEGDGEWGEGRVNGGRERVTGRGGEGKWEGSERVNGGRERECFEV